MYKRQFEKIAYDLRASSTQGEITFPRDLAMMNQRAIAQIAETHIAFLRENVSTDARRIVDKLPTNFLRLGLFSLLYPNARIIHCQREPMATCWSCFTKNFNTKTHLSFTFDLADLGFHYREYQRLMKHWHAVLPGKILDIPYEQLIQEPRGMSEAMIDHLGLDWEETCLKFNEQKTSVQTASSWQVRQPIYSDANAKWRQYEDHLGPLIEALESNGGS